MSDDSAPWSELASPVLLSKLAIVLLAVWINAADALVTATIMPSVAADIGGYSMFSWAVAGYLIGSVVAGTSSGRMAERFGLGPASALAGLFFAAGCLLGATATGIAPFLAGRVVQGIGSGWFSGFAMVAIAQLFPRRQLARIFAMVSTVWGIASLLGPMVGGLFAVAGHWRLVFWVFMAQALLFAILAPRAFGKAGPSALPGRIPVRQLGLTLLGIGAIVLADTLPGLVLPALAIAAGLILFSVLFALDRTASVPLLPRRAANPLSIVGAGYLTIFAQSVAVMPYTIYTPPILQQMLALTPLEAGYVVTSASAAWTCAAFLVANVSEDREIRPIRAGVIVLVAGAVLQAIFVPRLHIAEIVGAGLVLGLGCGLGNSLLNRRTIVNLDPGEEAIGSAALNTMRQIGGAVGAALAGVAANASGFAHGLTDASAMATAHSVFYVAIAAALLSLVGAFMMTRRSTRQAS